VTTPTRMDLLDEAYAADVSQPTTAAYAAQRLAQRLADALAEVEKIKDRAGDWTTILDAELIACKRERDEARAKLAEREADLVERVLAKARGCFVCNVVGGFSAHDSTDEEIRTAIRRLLGLNAS
jgi:hypothetical protein